MGSRAASVVTKPLKAVGTAIGVVPPDLPEAPDPFVPPNPDDGPNESEEDRDRRRRGVAQNIRTSARGVQLDEAVGPRRRSLLGE
jgi:hypothetical protein